MNLTQISTTIEKSQKINTQKTVNLIRFPTNELSDNADSSNEQRGFVPCHPNIKESSSTKNRLENMIQSAGSKCAIQFRENVILNKKDSNDKPNPLVNRVLKLPLMEKSPNKYETENRYSPLPFKREKQVYCQTVNISENKQQHFNKMQTIDPLHQIISENGHFLKAVLGQQNFVKIKSLERQITTKQFDKKNFNLNEKSNLNSYKQREKPEEFELNNQELPRTLRYQFTKNSFKLSSSPSPAKLISQQQTSFNQFQIKGDSSKIKQIPIKDLTFMKDNTNNQFILSPNLYQRTSTNFSSQLPSRFPQQLNNNSLILEEFNKKSSVSMHQTQLIEGEQNQNIQTQIQKFHQTVKGCMYRNGQKDDLSGHDYNQINQRKKKIFQQTNDKYNLASLIKRIPSSNIFEETYLKVFVGPGNNCTLIKNVTSQRWWYEVSDYNDKISPSIFSADSSVYSGKIYQEKSSSNQQITRKIGELIWTQTKINHIINDMPTLRELLDTQNPQMKLNKSHQRLGISQSSTTVSQLNLTKSSSQTDIKENKQQNGESHKEILNEQNKSNKNELISQNQLFELINNSQMRIYNHFECNYQICNKKSMYYNLKELYERRGENLLFERIPYTFHVKRASMKDPSYSQFIKYYNKIHNQNQPSKKNSDSRKFKNIWIVKPAENTNRGTGIFVSREIAEIKEYINSQTSIEQSSKPESANDGRNNNNRNRSPTNKNKIIKHTYIIQKYIENPLLYQKRKIDIRCYLLLTNYNGIFKAYWYKDGYIRTSSKEFTTKNLKNNFIHLTNDAIQKKQEDYGRFELGNKISYQEFQRYLDAQTEHKVNFLQTIVPKMKTYALDCVRSIFTKIDPNKRQYCFELFGLDYMIDNDLRVWLIEVNANPCLEQSCPLLSRIIPSLIHNTIKIAVDPLSQGIGLENWNQDKNEHFNKYYQQDSDKFECIFNELEDGEEINQLYGKVTNI